MAVLAVEDDLITRLHRFDADLLDRIVTNRFSHREPRQKYSTCHKAESRDENSSVSNRPSRIGPCGTIVIKVTFGRDGWFAKSRCCEKKPGAGPAFRSLPCDQSHGFKLQDHLMRAVVDLDILGLDAQFRVFRYIIRV